MHTQDTIINNSNNLVDSVSAVYTLTPPPHPNHQHHLYIFIFKSSTNRRILSSFSLSSSSLSPPPTVHNLFFQTLQHQTRMSLR
mmetsp:Transcript_14434/g.31084  ORF Transcript_14434/g.31084 Transcript_14434/m.31084 type:complete len:84 (+) Transcript_14434:275-526(+)